MVAIEMSPATKAFYAGVAAAQEVKATSVAEMANGAATSDGRLAQFWLLIGIRVAEFDSQEEVDAFVQGVMTHAPQRTGVLIEFSTESPQFHELDDSEDFEAIEQAFRLAITGVLGTVTRNIAAGFQGGDIVDRNRRIIGRYVIPRSEA